MKTISFIQTRVFQLVGLALLLNIGFAGCKKSEVVQQKMFINAKVIDKNTEDPLKGTRIYLVAFELRDEVYEEYLTSTNANGACETALDKATISQAFNYKIRARKDGYKAEAFPLGTDLVQSFDFKLAPHSGPETHGADNHNSSR